MMCGRSLPPQMAQARAIRPVWCGSLRERTLPQQRGAQSSEGGCAVLLRTWVRGGVCECECECMSVTVSTGVCVC